MRERLIACWSACCREFDVDTLGLVVGVLLITIGGWPVVGRAALIVPGGVLVWIALPARARFIDRGHDGPPIPRRNA